MGIDALLTDFTQNISKTLSNFNFRESFQYFIKNNAPENYLSIDNCSHLTYMKDIVFKNIVVKGTKIKSDSDWNLKIHGNISDLMYM